MKCNYYNLKELATIKYGKNQKNVISETGDFPIFGTGGLMGYATKYLYDKPTVMIGRKGTINKVRYYDKPFWTVDTLFYTEINENIIFPKFFYYLLSRVDFNQYNEGTTIPSLRTETLYRLEFEVPSLKVKDKIIKLLGPIENKIKLNEAINNNLEQQAMVIFDYFFPNITYGDKVIGDTIIPKRGKNLLSKNAVFGKVPVVAGGLTPLTYHNISNTVAPVLAISASGANAGYVSLWDKPIWSSDSSYIDSSMTKDVYFWYVLLKKRQTEIYESQTGSAQPHIYPKHIASMPVCDLKSEEISNFTLLVTPIFSMIHNNKEESIQLSILRETLLPKLLFGELDVSNIDI